MPRKQIFELIFADIYPLYIQKAERKKRTKEEVDAIIQWMTGYDQKGIEEQIVKRSDFKTFFEEAPCLNPKCSLITGVVCGIRVEEIEDPEAQKVRYLDKLIDELAKGKKMEKILRE